MRKAFEGLDLKFFVAFGPFFLALVATAVYTVCTVVETAIAFGWAQ